MSGRLAYEAYRCHTKQPLPGWRDLPIAIQEAWDAAAAAVRDSVLSDIREYLADCDDED
jgi:hypothetical protein